MTIQQNFGFRPHVEIEFTSTGVFGPNPLISNLMGNLRVVVENVDVGNEILVKGRLSGQTAWSTLTIITGLSTGTTVDISVVEELSFECTVYAASGGTPKLIASGFFKQASSGGSVSWGGILGVLSNQSDLQNALDEKEDLSNKASDFTILNQDLYPNTQAVYNEIKETLEGDGSYYFTTDASSWGGGRYQMIFDQLPSGGGTGISSSSVADGTSLGVWATEPGVPGVTFLPAGYMFFEVQARQTAGTQSTQLYAEFYRRDIGGFNHLLAITPLSITLTGSNQTVSAYIPTIVINSLNTTDGLMISIVASVTGIGTAPDITIDIMGNTSSRAKFPYNIPITDLSSKQDIILGSNNQLVYKNNSGVVETSDNWVLNNTTKGLEGYSTQTPNALNVYSSFKRNNLSLNPIADSPDDVWTVIDNYVEIDANHDGFSLGTTGEAVRFTTNTANHQGTSDIGSIVFTSNNFSVGNGTDPIDLKGISYNFGFGSINANVTVLSAIQGYGFQPNIDAAAIMGSGSYIQAFYDGLNVGCEINSYSSFIAGPTIASIANNNGYTAFNATPNITSFSGNAGVVLVGLYGNYSGFDTGGFTGVNINPTASGVAYANGISINMGGVTGSNIKALDVTGDVAINGSLSYSGSLSVGQLNAFYGTNPVDGGGNPQGLHGLVTAMTALNGVTVANADAIGVNTAMLITLEPNSVSTSAAFQLGFTSLALPCVVETHTGATLDYMSCVTGAVNLVGSSTGGTIDEVRVMRSVVIPNGITTINKSMAYFAHEPFGGVATDSWGLYILDSQKNYIEMPLKIGGGDTPDSGFILHAEGDTKLEGALEHLTGNVGFYGTTPVVQPASSGAVSAGGTYTATEQIMLQEVYDAIRALGLMS